MASEVGPQLQTVVRVALGLIFLLSATAKLRDPTRFVRAVLDYALLRGSLARLYGRMLPFVELGTALLLLSGFFLPIAAALAMLMLTSFETFEELRRHAVVSERDLTRMLQNSARTLLLAEL